MWLIAPLLNLTYKFKAWCSNMTTPVLDISALFCFSPSCDVAPGCGDAVSEGVLEEGCPISTPLSVDLGCAVETHGSTEWKLMFFIWDALVKGYSITSGAVMYQKHYTNRPLPLPTLTLVVAEWNTSHSHIVASSSAGILHLPQKKK